MAPLCITVNVEAVLVNVVGAYTTSTCKEKEMCSESFAHFHSPGSALLDPSPPNFLAAPPPTLYKFEGKPQETMMFGWQGWLPIQRENE